MRLSFKIFLLVLLPLSGFSQIIINNTGSPGILNREPNRQVTSIFVVPVYSDTASALTKGVDSLGMLIQIRTTGAWYKRDTATGGVHGHMWTLVASGGGGGGSDSGIAVNTATGLKVTRSGTTVYLSIDSSFYTTYLSRQGLSDSLQVLIAGKLTKTLAAGSIFIGNGSNIATAFAVTGAIAFSSSGVSTYNNGSLALAKIVTGTPNALIGYDGSGNPHEIAAGTNVTISGNQINAATGATGANPTQTIDGSVHNGAASTFMRSDAAPALAANGVSNTSLAQMPAHTRKGNITGSTANAADVTSTQETADLNPFTTTLQGMVPAPGSVSGKVLSDNATWVTASGTVSTQFSVQGDGTSGNKIQLVNDNNAPGNDFIYETDYSGTKGYGSPNVNWKNAIKLGIDPTGVVDGTALAQAANNAGYSIYFPNGTYKIIHLKLKDSTRIIGESTTKTIFKVTTADTVISLGNYCEVDHIYFKGNRTAGQYGINVDSVLGCNVHDIRGDSMGNVIRTARAALIPGNLFPYGNRFSSIQGRSNKVGMRFDVRGEYSNVSDVNFNQCDTSLINISGNNSFTNYSGTLGSVGMYEGTDNQNDGHASCTGCKFNHNTYPLIVANSTAGYTFNGCDFYFGKMQINNSTFIEFIGCDLKTDSLSFNTAIASFVGCKILSSPLLVGQTGSNNVTTLNCSDSHGVDFYDMLGAKHFYILNSGGSTTISNNLDKSMQTTWNGSLHMEYNTSAVTDPFQFYISGSTGSSFAILNYHLSPLYALRVDNNGNTGIHLTSPTAYFHIAAGTATAGTAPLKLTSGTVLTTPENGAIEYDGTHYWGTAGGSRLQLDNASSSGVTTVGTFSGSSQTNGGSIAGSTITFGIPSDTNPGMVKAGTYMPVLTNTTNISSSISDSASYTISGRVVTVNLSGQVSPTIAATFSTLTASLPFTSSITGQRAGSGVYDEQSTGALVPLWAVMGSASTVNLRFTSIGTSGFYTAIIVYVL